jgi:hypothetical protein
MSSPQQRSLSCTWMYLDCAALGLIYDTYSCAGLGPVYTLCPSFTWTCLHYRVLCCTWMGFLYRALSCTWTCLDNSSLHVLFLYLYIYTLQRPVLQFDVSTHWGVSFTWTCLNYRDLCCTRACLHTEAWASPGRVSSTGALARPRRVLTTESCARLYTNSVALLRSSSFYFSLRSFLFLECADFASLQFF